MQHLWIIGYIDEYGERVLCDGFIVFNKQLQVFYRLQLITLEERRLRARVTHEMLCRNLTYLGIAMV